MKKLFPFIVLCPFVLIAQNGQIAFKTYTINPDFCRGIQTVNGSLIFIPDNAFVMEDGNSCGEKIMIKYREFHSQTDMFYSKLNMLWDDNGKYRILESAGMFEMQAWCGDKKLKLKEDKQIQVRMKTRRNLEGLMSFIYNEEKNTWSKYPAPVMDFSYREKQNFADSTSFWGSNRTVTDNGAAVWDPETGNDLYVVSVLTRKLPEGFFKGINIKTLGIFNYDGVIKDSLAVPMVPEVIVRNENSTAIQALYVTYPNRNTLVYYTPEDFKEHFVLLSVKGIKLFTESKEGNFAISKDEEINSLSIEGLRGKNVKFFFDKVSAKPKNEKELSAATGLNTQ